MDAMRPGVLAGKLADSLLDSYSPDSMRWHYEDGLFLLALCRLARYAGHDRLLAFAKTCFDGKIGIDGRIATYRADEYNLDQVNPGKVLFELLPLDGDGRFGLAIEGLMDQLRTQPRTKGGSFWHKKIYPWQVWLDGLYMAGPFAVRYAAVFGHMQWCDDIVGQLQAIADHACDPRTGLLFHAWDESRRQLWADPETGCSPHLWGRAMGWYCMALVDVLEQLPGDHAGYAALTGLLGRCADAVLAVQDPVGGLWHQILDQGGRPGNYHESSASAMFIYFLSKACRSGYLAPQRQSEVLACARKAYDGLCSAKVRTDGRGAVHVGGICSVAGLGGKPYRDGSYRYYVQEPVVEDDLKGVGALILASIELEAALVQAGNGSAW